MPPGITHIATSKTNNTYLIDGDDGLTLVDVGSGKAADLLLRTIAESGRKPADLKRIVTGRLGFGPATFAAEPAALATGVVRVPTDVTAVGFGHGAQLSGPGADAFQAFLAKQR